MVRCRPHRHAGSASGSFALVYRLWSIDAFSQFLSSLEVRDILRSDLHGLASLGIAGSTRWAIAQLEAAKAPNLDSGVGLKLGSHGRKDSFHCKLYVLGGQGWEAGREVFDEFGAGHGVLLPFN